MINLVKNCLDFLFSKRLRLEGLQLTMRKKKRQPLREEQKIQLQNPRGGERKKKREKEEKMVVSATSWWGSHHPLPWGKAPPKRFHRHQKRPPFEAEGSRTHCPNPVALLTCIASARLFFAPFVQFSLLFYNNSSIKSWISSHPSPNPLLLIYPPTL